MLLVRSSSFTPFLMRKLGGGRTGRIPSQHLLIHTANSTPSSSSSSLRRQLNCSNGGSFQAAVSLPDAQQQVQQEIPAATDTVAMAGKLKIPEGEIQRLRENVDTLETLTVQQLRTILRKIEIPVRGQKKDLISSLKSFLMSNMEDEPSGNPSQNSNGRYSIDHDSSSSVKSSGQLRVFHRKRKSVVKDDQRTSEPCYEETNNLGVDVGNSVSSLKRYSESHKSVQDSSTNNDLVSTSVGVNEAIVESKGTKASRISRNSSSSMQKVKSSSVEVTTVTSVSTTEPWKTLAHKKPQPGWVPYNPSAMRPEALSGQTKSLKLISWNVNGLRALIRAGNSAVRVLAEEENFDVLCLQETKIQEKDIAEVKKGLLDGYENTYWTCSVSKLGYSGNAVISRIKPISVMYGIGIPDHDLEGRLVTVEFDSFYLISGYVPNSGDGLRRLSYRVQEWDPSLSYYMKELEKLKPVILTGDLNCAHQEIDIYNPAGNRRSAGFTDEERQSLEANFLSKGFIDSFRRQNPGVVGYTYWGYRHGGRVTNKGWRLDYFLVSECMADKIHDSYILPHVHGSDHCPIGLILKI